jgi:hypothetical protein
MCLARGLCARLAQLLDIGVWMMLCLGYWLVNVSTIFVKTDRSIQIAVVSEPTSLLDFGLIRDVGDHSKFCTAHHKNDDSSEIERHFVSVTRETARFVEWNIHVATVQDNFVAIGALGDPDQFVDNLAPIATALARPLNNDVFNVAHTRAAVNVLRLDNEACSTQNGSIERANDCVRVRVRFSRVELGLELLASDRPDGCELPKQLEEAVREIVLRQSSKDERHDSIICFFRARTNPGPV